MQLGTRRVSVQFKEMAATVVTVTLALKERNKKTLEQGFFLNGFLRGWGGVGQVILGLHIAGAQTVHPQEQECGCEHKTEGTGREGLCSQCTCREGGCADSLGQYPSTFLTL